MTYFTTNINSNDMGNANEADAERYADWLRAKLHKDFPEAEIKVTASDDKGSETHTDDDGEIDLNAYFEKYLEATNRQRVIFDNGGGITLQLNGWAHWYNSEAAQAARDFAKWIKDPDTNDWEGYESEAFACDPTDDEIRNGGYRVWAIGDDYPKPGNGQAEDEFFSELVALLA